MPTLKYILYIYCNDNGNKRQMRLTPASINMLVFATYTCVVDAMTCVQRLEARHCELMSTLIACVSGLQ